MNDNECPNCHKGVIEEHIPYCKLNPTGLANPTLTHRQDELGESACTDECDPQTMTIERFREINGNVEVPDTIFSICSHCHVPEGTVIPNWKEGDL